MLFCDLELNGEREERNNERADEEMQTFPFLALSQKSIPYKYQQENMGHDLSDVVNAIIVSNRVFSFVMFYHIVTII